MSNESKKEEQSTDLHKHKRDGSLLKPPFKQIPTLSPSSWKDDRLPELLWAVLLIGNLSREDALNIFRAAGKFVQGRDELYDITISSIAQWKREDRIAFIGLLCESHPKAKSILLSLVVFPSLPAFEDWVSVLGEPQGEMEKDLADYLANGVRVTLWHQSQEATDCRWVKVLCMVTAGKMKVVSGMYSEILNYPNEGDMRSVRPTIRASEIIQDPQKPATKDWPDSFWTACLRNTLCAPLPRKDQRKDKISISTYQITHIRHLLLLHYMKSDDTSSIDSKHDAIFGFGFYALRLLNELAVTNLSRAAIGRLVLRTCVESYITLAFLVKRNDPALWDDFRNYGVGQMKLSYLKARDVKEKPAFIDEEFLKEILNEDRWEEFSDIELSHWASSDLRKMSDEAGCKDVYDAYYSWTSTFSHGSWGSIRESNFAMCANPLHRLHLIPSVSVYPLPGVLEDVVKIVNLILGVIESEYPGLELQITNDFKPPKVPWYKRIYYRFGHRKMQRFFDFVTTGK